MLKQIVYGLIGICAAIMIGMFLLACVFTAVVVDTVDDVVTEYEERYVLLLETSTSSTFYGPMVSGVIKNPNDADLGYYSVTVKFYDEDNVLVYTGSDYITDLTSGESWEFNVYSFDDRAVKYRVSSNMYPIKDMRK